VFEFHKDKDRYFSMQLQNARTSVLPFVEHVMPIHEGMHVLEIGCAEGGVLKAFLERGCTGVGIELSPHRVELANEYLADEITNKKAIVISKNIYDVGIREISQSLFDLIILKDVIEHIHEQEKLMDRLKAFLKKDGKIFFGFPPWQMPFGGHQQVCKSKLLATLPYYHLLPKSLYKSMLKAGGESEATILDLMEVKETGISMERFERILEKLHYRIDARTIYLINPIYQYKFGITARKQIFPFKSIPYLRDFLSTCAYYLVSSE
jgi:SAM-dependent methyltransferase